VASDLQDKGLQVYLVIDRDAAAPGHQCRTSPTRCTTPSASADLDHLHPGQPVPRGAAGPRRKPGPQALEQIHVKATDGGQVRLSAVARIEQRQAQLAITTSASSRR
jgi:multidrug efflux pump